jgi:hypothetical protein
MLSSFRDFLMTLPSLVPPPDQVFSIGGEAYPPAAHGRAAFTPTNFGGRIPVVSSARGAGKHPSENREKINFGGLVLAALVFALQLANS